MKRKVYDIWIKLYQPIRLVCESKSSCQIRVDYSYWFLALTCLMSIWSYVCVYPVDPDILFLINKIRIFVVYSIHGIFNWKKKYYFQNLILSFIYSYSVDIRFYWLHKYNHILFDVDNSVFYCIICISFISCSCCIIGYICFILFIVVLSIVK